MPEIEFPRLVPGPGVWEAPWRLARAFSCLGEAERTSSVNKDGRKKPLGRKGNIDRTRDDRFLDDCLLEVVEARIRGKMTGEDHDFVLADLKPRHPKKRNTNKGGA